MAKPAFAAENTVLAPVLVFSRSRTRERAIASGDDMSGRTLLQTSQAATHALGEVRSRGGVDLADNDNRPPRGHRVGRDGLNRDEGDAATYLWERPQQTRKAIAVLLGRQPVGVLCLGLKVLRGAFQIVGVLRHLGRRAGIQMLSALDLD
jgi:hypothetical protein